MPWFSSNRFLTSSVNHDRSWFKYHHVYIIDHERCGCPLTLKGGYAPGSAGLWEAYAPVSGSSSLRYNTTDVSPHFPQGCVQGFRVSSPFQSFKCMFAFCLLSHLSGSYLHRGPALNTPFSTCFSYIDFLTYGLLCFRLALSRPCGT